MRRRFTAATLNVHVTAGSAGATAFWRENVYDLESERARSETQQRYWRRGRGEDPL
jgi:hypothetical protein